MHYAIIAAGEGSRLREEGVSLPKPLVQIEGLPMVDRLIGIMSRCRAESISIICNSAMTDVVEHLQAMAPGLPMHVITAQTPSSMHSLARLSEVIPEGKVVVTTVDTIFRETDFAAYVDAFAQSDGALFAVTPFVDDEKPLWVSIDESEASLYPQVTAFCDARPSAGHPMVSGGIYGFDTRQAWPVLHRCIAEGQSRMRNYQRALLAAGVEVHACVFDRIMDIDHADDIRKAVEWLQTAQPSVVLVHRAPEHSPRNVEKDAAIMDAVARRLKTRACRVTMCGEEDLPSALDADVVFHMARRISTLSQLSCHSGKVINDPRKVIQVAHSREYTLSLLQAAGISVPGWWAYDPEEDDMFQCEPALQQLLPGWVKATRSDGARPDDVAWVATALEADARVIELAAERVPDIVVMQHVEGDLLKVYCVLGNADEVLLLRTFYPQETGYTKFGEAELHNTPLVHTPFDRKGLEAQARSVGHALGLQVFGYDAIVRADGSVVVIDVNDWPSFSLCRDEAAEAISILIQ